MVELIVVIAILAILVGVLAPNLIRYLEQAKLEKDIQLLEAIRKTVQVAVMTEEDLQTAGHGGGYSEGIAFGKDMGYVPNPPLMFSTADSSGSGGYHDKPVGRAVAEMLGYADVAAMMDPDNGIIQRISSESPDKCSIWMWERRGASGSVVMENGTVEFWIAIARLKEDGGLEMVACVPQGHEEEWWF